MTTKALIREHLLAQPRIQIHKLANMLSGRPDFFRALSAMMNAGEVTTTPTGNLQLQSF